MLQRRKSVFNINTALLETTGSAGVPADNTDLFSIIIPDYSEVQIYSMRAHVRAAGGASSKIELVDSANAILASVAVDATGVVEASQAPVTYTNNSSSATYLKLRVDGSLDATTSFTIEIEHDDFSR